MLIRLVYLSRPASPQTVALTDSIMHKAHAWNTANEEKIVWPEFDPYSATGALVMARIDGLVARGSPVQPT